MTKSKKSGGYEAGALVVNPFYKHRVQPVSNIIESYSIADPADEDVVIRNNINKMGA